MAAASGMPLGLEQIPKGAIDFRQLDTQALLMVAGFCRVMVARQEGPLRRRPGPLHQVRVFVRSVDTEADEKVLFALDIQLDSEKVGPSFSQPTKLENIVLTRPARLMLCQRGTSPAILEFPASRLLLLQEHCCRQYEVLFPRQHPPRAYLP